MRNRLHVLYASNVPSSGLVSVLDQIQLPDTAARIAIKPNLVLAKPSESGATTDPSLASSVIAYLRDRGYRNIKIMESSWVGDSTRRAFKICGYEDISKRYGVPLVDLKRDKTVTRSVNGVEIAVCREVLETDFLINMPVLKAHCQTRLTCALKNLKGCIPDREKRHFHALGLHKPIAALNAIVKSHLVIVDGIIGDLTFEEGGTPVHMGRIIVGEDPVLVDSYAAQLLGYDIDDIPYIGMAERLGVGTTRLDTAEIIEHNKAAAQKRQPQPARRTVERLAHCVEERKACSACYGSLIHALMRYEQRHRNLPPHLRVAIGQDFQNQPAAAEPILGIGRCTTGFTDDHVPGCPPTARAILEKLEEWAGQATTTPEENA